VFLFFKTNNQKPTAKHLNFFTQKLEISHIANF